MLQAEEHLPPEVGISALSCGAALPRDAEAVVLAEGRGDHGKNPWFSRDKMGHLQPWGHVREYLLNIYGKQMKHDGECSRK